jgi:hypothetical protein
MTVADGLRAWAAGVLATEAAAELLIRSFDGKFASVDWLWIEEGSRPGSFWLNADALLQYSGGLSAGVRRVLSVVAALASSGPVPDLADVLAGVDREHLQLLLAAFAHAGGSHEHVDVAVTSDGYSYDRRPPLVLWPDPARTVCHGG